MPELDKIAKFLIFIVVTIFKSLLYTLMFWMFTLSLIIIAKTIMDSIL